MDLLLQNSPRLLVELSVFYLGLDWHKVRVCNNVQDRCGLDLVILDHLMLIAAAQRSCCLASCLLTAGFKVS